MIPLDPATRQEVTTFYRIADNVAVFDAHTGNLIKTPYGLEPIDAVALHPHDWLLELLEHGLEGASR